MRLNQSDGLLKAFFKATTSTGFMAPAIGHWALQAFSVLAQQPKDIMDHSTHTSTVLLTPGFTHSGRDMYEVAQVLAEKSNVAFVPTLPWLSKGLVDISELILARLEEVMKTRK